MVAPISESEVLSVIIVEEDGVLVRGQLRKVQRDRPRNSFHVLFSEVLFVTMTYYSSLVVLKVNSMYLELFLLLEHVVLNVLCSRYFHLFLA